MHRAAAEAAVDWALFTKGCGTALSTCEQRCRTLSDVLIKHMGCARIRHAATCTQRVCKLAFLSTRLLPRPTPATHLKQTVLCKSVTRCVAPPPPMAPLNPLRTDCQRLSVLALSSLLPPFGQHHCNRTRAWQPPPTHTIQHVPYIYALRTSYKVE